MKSFHPRFSIRKLAIVVTLVCAYFGAWEATKRFVNNRWKDAGGYPVPDIGTGFESLLVESIVEAKGVTLLRFVSHVESPAPLFIILDGFERPATTSRGLFAIRHTRRYCLWLFGPIIELPFET